MKFLAFPSRWCRKGNVRRHWRNILIWILLLACGTEFWIRGPHRLLHATGWNDFLSPYIQAKAWAHGKDPYSARVLISLWPPENSRPSWVDADAAQGTLEKKRGMPTPYPLTSLVVLSPLTFLNWTWAMRLWICLSIGTVLGSALALISISDATLSEPRSQIFLAAVFALAPLHTGLATANPVILAASLGIFAVATARSGRTKWTGILIACAFCLKPTIAIGLLLYYAVRREFRVVAISCGASVVVELVGIWRSAKAGVPWLSSYIASTHRIFAPGSLADFTRADSVRFNMLNGQVLFYPFVHNAQSANLLAWLSFFLLAACWVRLACHSGVSDILKISAVSILTLIPIYHRFYDAVLLMWPIAWSVFLARIRSLRAATLIMIAPFLVPGAVLLAIHTQAGRIRPSIASEWWWNTLVLSHEAWAVVLLGVILLYSMSVERRQATQKQELAARFPDPVRKSARA
jgi:Glycosyltransferase family 87